MHKALDDQLVFRPSRESRDIKSIKPAFNFVSEHNLDRGLDGFKKGKNFNPSDSYTIKTPMRNFAVDYTVISPETNT